MRIRVVILALAALACGNRAFTGDHLVSPDETSARHAAAAEARQADLAAVEAVLSSRDAATAAASLRVDIRQLRSAAASLSDAELRDLAARVQALRSDPAAGLSRDVDQLLVIFLIVAIVILVLKAVD
jgi:hypothetical protein